MRPVWRHRGVALQEKNTLVSETQRMKEELKRLQQQVEASATHPAPVCRHCLSSSNVYEDHTVTTWTFRNPVHVFVLTEL